VIEVPAKTWVVVWGLSAVFCFLMILDGDHPPDLAWGWAVFGWAMLGVHMKFQTHINRTLSM
jgi:hypothetical protein